MRMCNIGIHTMYKVCLEGCPNYSFNLVNCNQCVTIKRHTKIISYFEWRIFIRFTVLKRKKKREREGERERERISISFYYLGLHAVISYSLKFHIHFNFSICNAIIPLSAINFPNKMVCKKCDL